MQRNRHCSCGQERRQLQLRPSRSKGRKAQVCGSLQNYIGTERRSVAFCRHQAFWLFISQQIDSELSLPGLLPFLNIVLYPSKMGGLGAQKTEGRIAQMVSWNGHEVQVTARPSGAHQVRHTTLSSTYSTAKPQKSQSMQFLSEWTRASKKMVLSWQILRRLPRSNMALPCL